MANIVVWKRKNIKPANYKELKIKKLFKVKDGILDQIYTEEETIKMLYEASQTEYSKYDKKEEDNVITELHENELVHQIVRGKYLSVFFLLFCNSIYNDFSTIGIVKTNKGRLLNDSDIMETIAPRARVPQSLSNFVNNTIVKYFKNNIS